MKALTAQEPTTPEEHTMKEAVTHFLEVVAEWSSLDFQERLAVHHGTDDESLCEEEQPS